MRFLSSAARFITFPVIKVVSKVTLSKCSDSATLSTLCGVGSCTNSLQHGLPLMPTTDSCMIICSRSCVFCPLSNMLSRWISEWSSPFHSFVQTPIFPSPLRPQSLTNIVININIIIKHHHPAAPATSSKELLRGILIQTVVLSEYHSFHADSLLRTDVHTDAT